MKLLSLFLAVLTVAYLLPFSVFAENVANDAVNRGEIERFELSESIVVSVNSGASMTLADSLQGLERILMDLAPARAINSEINKIFNLKG